MNLNEGKETKSALLSKVIKITGAMTKNDLNDLLSNTLEVSPNPDADGKSDVNIETPATETVSAAVAEDVKEIFGSEELSEEFKTKVTTLFEAALNNRLEIERVKLQEEMEVKLQEEIDQVIEEISEAVNSYTDYIAEEWYKENEVEIENSFKVAVSESFLDGLKGLFTEHNVATPEEDTESVMNSLIATVEELEEELNKVRDENIALSIFQTKILETERFMNVSEGLAATEVEKLAVLCENMEYTTLDEFEEKIKIIRQQYFDNISENKTTSSSVGLINEDVIGDDQQQIENVVPDHMKRYVTAISKTVQK